MSHFIDLDGFNCFLIARKIHLPYESTSEGPSIKKMPIVGMLEDPSTVGIVRTIRGALKIKDIISRYKIEVVHILYAEPNALWLFWKFLYGVPVILTTRGTDILKTIPSFFATRKPLHFLVALQYRIAFNNADFITCTSQSQLDSVKHISSSVENISLVRTGVDFELLNRSNRDMISELGLPNNIVLMPRAIRPLYNHEFTLQGIANSSVDVRKRYCFVFLVSKNFDEQYYVNLRRTAEGIDADIRFVRGLDHEEVLALYKQVALVIMNPLSDGTPASGLEVLACGTPLILGPLQYDDAFTVDLCYKLKSWDVFELSEQIVTTLGMEQPLKEVLRAESKKRMQEKASFTANMNKLKDIYLLFSDEANR